MYNMLLDLEKYDINTKVPVITIEMLILFLRKSNCYQASLLK